MLLIIQIIVWIIVGSIFGIATNAIIRNKGYWENWFWWGFFFGFIAMLVAMSKPENRSRMGEQDGSTLGNGYTYRESSSIFRDSSYENRKLLESGYWKCQHCGRMNASYVGTCGCGYDKSGNMPQKDSQQTQRDEQTVQPQVFYCTSCGKQMEADSKFCRYCGAEQK